MNTNNNTRPAGLMRVGTDAACARGAASTFALYIAAFLILVVFALFVGWGLLIRPAFKPLPAPAVSYVEQYRQLRGPVAGPGDAITWEEINDYIRYFSYDKSDNWSDPLYDIEVAVDEQYPGFEGLNAGFWWDADVFLFPEETKQNYKYSDEQLQSHRAGVREAVKLYLADQELQEFIDRWIATPNAAPPVNVAEGESLFNHLLPQLSMLRKIARCEQASAAVAWEAGDVESAALHIERIGQLARNAKWDPFPICFMSGVSIQHFTHKAVQGFVLFGDPSASAAIQLGMALQQVRSAIEPGDIERAYEAEQIFVENEIDLFFKGKSDVTDEVGMNPLERIRVIPAQKQVEMSKQMFEDIQQNTRVPFHAYDESYEELVPWETYERYFPLHVLVGAERRTFTSAWSTWTKLDLTRIALAIESYMADHDQQPPASLDALVPKYIDELPKDGYNPAGEFGYRLLADGEEFPGLHTNYVLYSIGVDGKDNNGTPPPLHDPDYTRHKQDVALTTYTARGDYVFGWQEPVEDE